MCMLEMHTCGHAYVRACAGFSAVLKLSDGIAIPNQAPYLLVLPLVACAFSLFEESGPAHKSLGAWGATVASIS